MSDDAKITIDEGDGQVLVMVEGAAQGMTVHLQPNVAREVAAHLVKYADHEGVGENGTPGYHVTAVVYTSEDEGDLIGEFWHADEATAKRLALAVARALGRP